MHKDIVCISGKMDEKNRVVKYFVDIYSIYCGMQTCGIELFDQDSTFKAFMAPVKRYEDFKEAYKKFQKGAND